MHIAPEFQQITVLVDEDRFVSALVEVADPAMALVKGGGVADIKMAHELGEVALGGANEQMKMIAHQHVGMTVDLVIGVRAPELFQEDRSVAVVAKDRAAIVAAAGDVVEAAGN